MVYNAFMTKRVTVSIRMPQDMYEVLAQQAADEKRSISNLIVVLLAEHPVVKQALEWRPA